MKKTQILDILFWLFLIIGIIMIIWRIFGSSPSDLAIIIPFIVVSLVKIWSNNDKIKDIGYQVKILSSNTKSAFIKIKEDFEDIRKDINDIKTENKKFRKKK